MRWGGLCKACKEQGAHPGAKTRAFWATCGSSLVHWGLILSRIKATSSLKESSTQNWSRAWTPGEGEGKGNLEWELPSAPWAAQPSWDRDTPGWETPPQPFHTPPAPKKSSRAAHVQDWSDTGHPQQYLKRTDISFYQKIRAGGGKSHLEPAKRSRIPSSSHSQCPQGRRNCIGVIISSAFVQVAVKMHFPGPVELWTGAQRVPVHGCCILRER